MRANPLFCVRPLRTFRGPNIGGDVAPAVFNRSDLLDVQDAVRITTDKPGLRIIDLGSRFTAAKCRPLLSQDVKTSDALQARVVLRNEVSQIGKIRISVRAEVLFGAGRLR